MTTEQGVQGIPQIHGLQSTLSELTQQCKAHHHLIYHTLRPLLTCVMPDTSQMPDHAPTQVQLKGTNFEGDITEGDKVCYP